MTVTEGMLATMEQIGGSFVRRLAELYRLGDADNRRRLEVAFPEYWNHYHELTNMRTTHADSRESAAENAV